MPSDTPPARDAVRRRDLSRDRIVKAALRIADRDGVAALSMRGVADALGVTPMALYNHVAGKSELLTALAEHLIARAGFRSDHGGWRAQVRHAARALRALCLRHPWLPELLRAGGAAPPGIAAPVEAMEAALRGAGLDGTDAARVAFLIIGFILTQADHQARGPLPGLARGGCTADAPWDFDAAFEVSVTIVLAGVEARMAGRHDGD